MGPHGWWTFPVFVAWLVVAKPFSETATFRGIVILPRQDRFSTDVDQSRFRRRTSENVRRWFDGMDATDLHPYRDGEELLAAWRAAWSVSNLHALRNPLMLRGGVPLGGFVLCG